MKDYILAWCYEKFIWYQMHKWTTIVVWRTARNFYWYADVPYTVLRMMSYHIYLRKKFTGDSNLMPVRSHIRKEIKRRAEIKRVYTCNGLKIQALGTFK